MGLTKLEVEAHLWPAVDGPGRWTRCEVAEAGSWWWCGCVTALVWNNDDVVEERDGRVGVISRRWDRCILDTLDVTDLLTATARRRTRSVRKRTPPTDNHLFVVMALNDHEKI